MIEVLDVQFVYRSLLSSLKIDVKKIPKFSRLESEVTIGAGCKFHTLSCCEWKMKIFCVLVFLLLYLYIIAFVDAVRFLYFFSIPFDLATVLAITFTHCFFYSFCPCFPGPSFFCSLLVSIRALF